MSNDNTKTFVSAIESLIDHRINQRLDDELSEIDGGPSEEDVLALIEKHAITDETGDYADELDDLIVDARQALNRLELSTKPEKRWTVGPSVSTDDVYHTNPLWGLHFTTEHDIYLGQATVESLSPGTCHIHLYRYEAGELVALVDSTEIAFNGNRQTVTLDLYGGPGEYLLSRPITADRHDNDDYTELPEFVFTDDDAVSLRRRAQYDGWEADNQHGVTFYGGAHPIYSDNDYYYYFYDLDIAVAGAISDDDANDGTDER